MEIKLKVNKKPIEPDEFLNEEEMELSPFHFFLVELSQHLNGFIDIIFNDKLNIRLDLFSDFSVCLEDIIYSINAAKTNHCEREEIWFCEQGSDFYIYYKVNGNRLSLSYKKGEEVGGINKEMPDFIVHVDTSEYIEKWRNVFQELRILFEQVLHKKIPSPLQHQ
ncbi:hypothetical protein EXT68_21810 [Pectobacterium parmentieri]|uniref:Uncharacterized protein n=1 Tax=Pectobacterium parmentieri TaxID=1905730 RepID=A0A0H3IAI3_PECPM|nr:hypothetical protein [Pectobacterium parmentieri]AFI92031.1 Hypothetical protein W5S_3968 [Pectobacterium parmentieri]MBI0473279.1 hypothetical protein [Pectobacterium parmentieri]MBI0495902.1 hypothetical protein [Pectobacterium parmentieri]MBI0557318.1 hypothetical protein [Pectobacterium parmentieri]MBI0570451.1 hypothetical protein [Pectobacterium parmentieri]